MAKRKPDTQLAITPLKGVVRILGEPPKVATKALGARVADLAITLTGGKAGFPATMNFALALNTALAAKGSAELIDEATASRSMPATRNAKGYVFANVKLTEPGQAAARVFRITNVRANVSGLGTGGLSTSPIIASIAISGSTSTPLRLSGVRQVVALASPKTVTKSRKRVARRGTASIV